jgi:hypothetical protein
MASGHHRFRDERTSRTLLILGSLTVAGIGLLDRAYEASDDDGAPTFDRIIALSSVADQRRNQSRAPRVTGLQILPDLCKAGQELSIQAALTNLQHHLKDVTHVAFTCKFPGTDSRLC